MSMSFCLNGRAANVRRSQSDVSSRLLPSGLHHGSRLLARTAPSGISRRSLCVQAYRDRHREATITQLGGRVVDSLFQGIAKGPAAAEACLNTYLDPKVDYRSDQVLETVHGKGLDLVRERLEAEHHRLEVEGWKVLASAACSEDDTYFALVKYTYHSRILHGEHSACVGYKVIEMDVMLDDTVRRITSVHERSQLAPEDVGCLASIDSAQALCALAPFPEAALGPYPAELDPKVVTAGLGEWCKARCSGKPESPLSEILHPSFRLHDAYGLLPVLCDPARRAAGEPNACVVPYDQVQDIIHQSKDRYDIDCHLVDCAVSQDHNVAFTHWHSNLVNKADGNKFGIEGLEVDVFHPDGRIQDIWLFRDPMDFEAAILRGQDLSGGAASGAQVLASRG